MVHKFVPHIAKTLNFLLALVLLASLFLAPAAPAGAQMPPVDPSKVPHYFGPWPNWANSPFTLPDAQVMITGDGAGAAAEAVVGANGMITAINVTNPGSGYTNASVEITGGGSGAQASAQVVTSGMVTAVNLTQGGSGYTAPQVLLSGGGATQDATATAYGSVDAVSIIDPGSGYTFPTVDFDMPDAPDGIQARGHVVCVETDCIPTSPGAAVTITGVTVDYPGSGYSHAPGVAIHDGTLFDPINNGGAGATAVATLTIQNVILDTYGSGYTGAPSVVFSDPDPNAGGATATAETDFGGISGITLISGGSGYVTTNGIKKFTDNLPGLCVPPACPTSGKYIPVAVAEPKKYNGIEADEYVIGLVQYRISFSSSLPATLVRGYVQLETAANASISQHYPLTNELMDGTQAPVTKNDGSQWLAVTPPQFLGPVIAATHNKPVRIVFYNLLPNGVNGDLFLPADSTLMGSGMGPMEMADPMDMGSVLDEVRNPMCTQYPKMNGCFKDNRATLHLHGGNTPWISDGTAHQWTTPAGEVTDWPQGVSVKSVPDMLDGNGGVLCDGARDGCLTFYYTNQQSARLLFYHDHAWGITRLNVYAGEAAGYLITDDTEKALINSGAIPGAADTIPLIVQDRTFVPDAAQLALQDPTWDTARWGSKGSFWYHHVYMPAQNPGDPSGMSAYGRWMYGPWFWPPAADTKYGPIANPYYDPNCDLDNPSTWQYDTDPFCEPQEIPGTPNISVGMEQFNDTPIVNGVAYPTITLQPKTYRLRMLNAANDRFFNFQWYVGDPSTASNSTNANGEVIGATEVALNPAELEAAQTDPVVFPTPVQGIATAGPDWIHIGSEGGFLPAPAVVDGQQPTTWITDPTRFDVGNVDKHSLLLAPAERADVIVDFSKFAGKTLILYNDAPAAFPARVPSYDYYTGAPDLSPTGAPRILPGYGPNTRTIMQVKIANATPATAFNLTRLQTAFRHSATGGGVFESGQHPVIVGQAAYNSAYGTSFAASSNCNAPGSTLQRCDGLVRVNDTSAFGFNTLRGQTTKMILPLQPKAIHDEMNATTFDEFGRMQANLGVEAQPPTPGAQNVTLYPFVNPATELIDATNLPKADVVFDAVTGLPVNELKISAIGSSTDGTQIWRITHNGVDTHPIHFHMYDVQLINRVTWDNIIIPTEPGELGWKDTIRVSPLQDTIVALRPVVPEVPWELPNSIRPLNPMMPLGSTAMFNNIDPQGNPTTNVINQLVNFGWEFVYHCHILSHEEMDMMRPVSVAMPPLKPTALAATINGTNLTLTWNDNSIAETAYLVQRRTGAGAWETRATIATPLDQANTTGQRTFSEQVQLPTNYQYQVVAENRVGYGAEFPVMVVTSTSDALTVVSPPSAPANLVLQLASGPAINMTWTDTATNEDGFILQRNDNNAGFAPLTTLGARAGTGAVTYSDTTVQPGHTYQYQVAAYNVGGQSNFTTSTSLTVPLPTAINAPTNLAAALQTSTGNPPTVNLTWTDNATNETGFLIFRGDNGAQPIQIGSRPQRTNVGSTNYIDSTAPAGGTYVYYVVAVNGASSSAPSNQVTVVIPPAPAGPTTLTFTTSVTSPTAARIVVSWTDTSNETRYQIQRALNPSFNPIQFQNNNLPANSTTFTMNNLARGTTYYIRVRAQNLYGSSAWVTITVVTP